MILNIDIETLLEDAQIALVVYLLMYLIYYFSNTFAFIKRFNTHFKEEKGFPVNSVYFRRVLGFILLGLIPLIVMVITFDKPLIDYGLGLPSGDNLFLWIVVPFVIFITGSLLRNSKHIDTVYYPEVKQKHWDSKKILINSMFWLIYLLGYEFAIRGMLFFSSLYEFGLWPAIIISSVIYSLIHIFKGRGEAFGAFFLGIIFCLITYYTNSIWIAFVLHAVIAIINDIKAIKQKERIST